MMPRPACFGADRWPDDPDRLPDRRRAGAARPAAPPLAMTLRTPPGAGPMTTARPPPRPYVLGAAFQSFTGPKARKFSRYKRIFALPQKGV